MGEALRILIVDDHTMVRQTMRRAMEDEGFHVVGEAGDGDEAVKLAERLTPDVVLMDVTMPVLDGVAATRLVRRAVPDSQVVMLTMHDDESVVRRALEAGAVGYLTKDCTIEEIAQAVRLAGDGETFLSRDLASSMLEEAQREEADPVISAREEEVLQLIANGASPSEVAEELFISVRTVKNHLASIYQKLDARDRTQAVLKGVRLGIIRLE